MEKFTQHEFKCPEMDKFMSSIRKQSIELIDRIIKDNSLIQLDEIVEIPDHGNDSWMKVKVSQIELCLISSWTPDRYSFRYHGLLLNKKGEVMKNRLPVWFSGYRVKGEAYSNPSYYRFKIVPASLQGERF